MASVTVGEKENLERALRRFKKKVDEEGILKEYKERRYYRKPSVVKREKLKSAIRKSHLKSKEAETLETGRSSR